MKFFKWIHNFDIGVLKKGICLAESSIFILSSHAGKNLIRRFGNKIYYSILVLRVGWGYDCSSCLSYLL